MSNFPFWFLIILSSPLFAQDAIEATQALTGHQVDPLVQLLASGGSTPLGLIVAALILKGFSPRIRVIIENPEDLRTEKREGK